MRTIARTITLLSFAVLLLTGLAGAQYFHPAVKANIPFEFSAGGKTLPAGTYRLIRATPYSFFLMDSQGQVRALVTSTGVSARKLPSATKLVFYIDGSRRILGQVWMQDDLVGREFVHRRKVTAVAELGVSGAAEQAAVQK